MNTDEPTILEEIERISAEEPAVTHPGWLFQHEISRGERAEVLRHVMLDSDPRWFVPFVVMLSLSAGIAALGLSQDSAATVIGAMVVAPLGQPIAALGGAVALAWPREIVKMLFVTLGGAALVVGLAYVIGTLLPAATPTDQILSRTSPDLRDLGVALFAGGAGAFAQTRSSLSSTLTGVAIAVALVPPLAAVGLLLEDDHLALAQGAGLLFVANFVGIVLAVAATLLITRFAPLPRLRRARWRSMLILGSTLVVAGLVMVPLTAAYVRLAGNATTTTAVQQQVASVLGTGSATILRGVEIEGNTVTIDLQGGETVPSEAAFEDALMDELGPDIVVTVRQR